MNMNKHIRYMLFCLMFVTVLFTVNYLTGVITQGGRSVRQIVTNTDINFNIRAKGRSLLDEATELFKPRHAPSLNYVASTIVLSNHSSGYGTCHLGANDIKLDRKPVHYVYFTKNYSLDKEPARSALSESVAKRFCDDKIVSYGNRIVILHDVVMFPKERSDHGVSGGEKVIKVLNQQVSKEHYQYRTGFLKLKCSKDSAKLGSAELSNKWLKSVKYEDADIKMDKVDNVQHFVIAIERGDYANLHNWARGIFNTFLMMIKFKVQPDEMSVLFLDAHPYSALDLAWEEIFGPIQRIGHLQNPVMYKNLVFTFKESDGPVSDYHHKTIGETEEYRTFVLSRHGINSQAAKLTCPKIKITIIIRRNAVYHPRNTEGKVGRKIFNEAEIIEGLMRTFPHACVQAVMMEMLPFYLQLEIISQTDLLIGMHGAGMSHTLFLPQHAAVLELFPKGFKTNRPWFECYQGIARWRGLKYDTWENFDPSIEMPHDYTILPVDVVVNKSKGLIDKLCNS